MSLRKWVVRCAFHTLTIREARVPNRLVPFFIEIRVGDQGSELQASTEIDELPDTACPRDEAVAAVTSPADYSASNPDILKF